MTVSPVTIIGFASTDFVPGFVGETVLGAGPASASSIPFKLLLVGNKLATGSAVANVDTNQIYSETDARNFWGPGSELHRMARAALRIPGVVIFGSPVLESVGAAATMTITYATNATSAGTFTYWIDGERIDVAVALGDTPTIMGATLVSVIAGKDFLPVTAANAAGTVTLTRKQKGPRGNFGEVYQDATTAPPGGTTSTLATTGASVTGGGKRFGGGTTIDDVTAVSTNTFPAWFQRVALAQNDSANLAVWKTNTGNKAGPLEGRPEHVVVASNDTLANTQSLSQSTLNDGRFSMLWMLEAESHPAELAAVVAAIRVVTESADPGSDYDDAVLPGIAPSRYPAQIPQRSTKTAALQTGVTPIYTVNGQALVSRSITTRCLNGASPDYRCIDTGQSSVADFIRIDLSFVWQNWNNSNPVLADDPAPEQGDRPSGVGTPARWNGVMTKRLKQFERGEAVTSGIPQIIDVDLNPCSSGWDSVAKRIMSLCPVAVAPRNHQIGVSVRQL